MVHLSENPSWVYETKHHFIPKTCQILKATLLSLRAVRSPFHGPIRHLKRSSPDRFTMVGNSGIGVETTLQLALRGARVYVAARSPEKVTKAIADMKASHKQSLDLHALELDLQSFQSTKDAAKMFMKKEARLDILVNNAGVSTIIPPFGHSHSPIGTVVPNIRNRFNLDHGCPLQAHTQWIRIPMANQPPRPIPPHKLSPPTPLLNSRLQPLQNPRSHRQRLEQCSTCTRHGTKSPRPRSPKPRTHHRPNVRMVSTFRNNHQLSTYLH